ncbi:hypothetical protein XENOCAPTIV_007522 [Xenoophorus captivus]|uniref:Uncharacterized protein n=1 Tax=Xenoophorus captivus TaxID=1517983 RepID=A0ABV0RTK9_9TELE
MKTPMVNVSAAQSQTDNCSSAFFSLKDSFECAQITSPRCTAAVFTMMSDQEIRGPEQWGIQLCALFGTKLRHSVDHSALVSYPPFHANISVFFLTSATNL